MDPSEDLQWSIECVKCPGQGIPEDSPTQIIVCSEVAARRRRFVNESGYQHGPSANQRHSIKSDASPQLHRSVVNKISRGGDSNLRVLEYRY